MNLTVAEDEQEAAAIARLLGEDRTRIVGWVYRWNTSALSVLWIDRPCTARHIEPSLRPEVLAKAKSATPDEVTDFLEALSSAEREDPEAG